MFEQLNISKPVGKLVSSSIESVFGEINHSFEAQYEKLLLTKIYRDRYIDYISRTIGSFPLFGTNLHASIEHSYVKIGISDELERERYRDHNQIEQSLLKQKNGHLEDSFRTNDPKDLLEIITCENNGIALLGGAGSGKTTIFRHLALDAASGKEIGGKKRIPLFILVRDLDNSKGPIENSIRNFFDIFELKETERVAKSFLHSGRLMILLDGLDEAEKELQQILLKEMFKFRDIYPEVIFCVSARPYTLSIGLRGFTKWETLPLSIEDRKNFIEKWFSVADKKKGVNLIKLAEKNKALLDIGSNPLLLSIVCALYHNDLNVPIEHDELYSRAVEGILGGWDSFRSIARKTILRDLPVRKRIALVSSLAYELFINGVLIFDYKIVSSIFKIDEACHRLKIDLIDPEDLIATLYNDFSLLVERAPGIFSFSHLTFQEFLTAKYIVDNRKEMTLLREKRNKEEWFEVITFIAQGLNNADDFMCYLTLNTSINNSYEMSLLESTWCTKPICDSNKSTDTLKRMSSKLVTAIGKLDAKIEIKENGISITYPRLKKVDDHEWRHMNIKKKAKLKKSRRRVTKKRRDMRAILKQIPPYLNILQSAGLEIPQLGLEEKPIFKEVIWAGLAICDWIKIEDRI